MYSNMKVEELIFWKKSCEVNLMQAKARASELERIIKIYEEEIKAKGGV